MELRDRVTGRGVFQCVLLSPFAALSFESSKNFILRYFQKLFVYLPIRLALLVCLCLPAVLFPCLSFHFPSSQSVSGC